LFVGAESELDIPAIGEDFDWQEVALVDIGPVDQVVALDRARTPDADAKLRRTLCDCQLRNRTHPF
jgi:hypothetical protein